MQLKANEIRSTFLNFFVKNAHTQIEPASIIPKNDPTLLFINSGMAPLKPFFEGLQQPKASRLTNYQPCIRTNDIDDVGDRHHLTMFEMLGSWSIGDYYKETAIPLAWELLTKKLGFPEDRLYVTVYAGDEATGVPADRQSLEAWKLAGVAPKRIVVLGEDNFWGPAGTSGPCGPCTEVFFDTGDAYGTPYVPGTEFDTKHRYIEIWNAGVFMEMKKAEDGSFSPLPLKSVDTGSGLERMELAQNGLSSVYETTALKPLVELLVQDQSIGGLSERDRRILVDHARAMTFIIAAGVVPSNEGRGYIPRKLIRRCVTILTGAGAKDHNAVFTRLVHKVVELNQPNYGYIKEAEERVLKAVLGEVTRFKGTLNRCEAILSREAKRAMDGTMTAKVTFDAVTAKGIPLEILRHEAQRHGLVIDEIGFEQLMVEHKKKSRPSAERKLSQSFGKVAV
jgi:alanyl-tRNA synthetase